MGKIMKWYFKEKWIHNLQKCIMAILTRAIQNGTSFQNQSFGEGILQIMQQTKKIQEQNRNLILATPI
jgi:hypothetical protein